VSCWGGYLRRTMSVGWGLVVCGALFTLSRKSSALPTTLEELPSGVALSMLPAVVPPSILASESVAGVFVQKSGPSYAGARNHSVMVFESKAAYEAFSQQGAVGFRRSYDACFSPAYPTSTDDPEKLRGWETSSEPFVHFITTPGYRRMGAVRKERLKEQNGVPVLEVTDFWVDTKTGGVRSFGQSQLEFKEVARPYDGIAVYATRTGENQVELLVRLVESRIERELFENLGGAATEQLAQARAPADTISVESGPALRSACGHLRMRLELRAEGSSNASGTVLLVPGQVTSEQEFFSARANAIRMSSSSMSVRLSPLTGWRQMPEGEQTPLGRLRSFDSRSMALNLGLSRMSSDSSPVLSVSYRWSAPPTTIRVFSRSEAEGGGVELVDSTL
jgi:hypothetical protein